MTKNGYNRKIQKERRIRLIEAGLCYYCGKVFLENDKICNLCRQKQRKRQQAHDARVRSKAKEIGWCLCGRDKPLPGLKICKKCQERNATQAAKRKEKGQCSYCSNMAITGKRRCDECSQKNKCQKQLLRQEVFNAYGGPICNCCGETIDRFLTLDHVNNDGKEHRKKVGDTSVMRWLKKNNFPPGFQVLCFNCNFGKYLNNGNCPHKG